MWNRSRYNKYLVKQFKTVGKEEVKYCEVCGKPADAFQIHPHHVLSVSHKATAWDIANRVWVCAQCHTLNGMKCVQNNIGGWFLNWNSQDDWMHKHKPEEKEYLRLVHNKAVKWDMEELEKHRQMYQQVSKNLYLLPQLKYLALDKLVLREELQEVLLTI